MFVSVAGVRGDGARVERSWHLVAEGDDGPFIPSMAAAALICHHLDGRTPAPGARAAINDVELDDYEALFAQRKIVFGCREVAPETAALPLYRRLLGEAYDSLPQPIREMHDLTDEMTVKGRAKVVRGKGQVARLVAWIAGFPRAGDDIPLEVRFRVTRGRQSLCESWRRSFGGHIFASTQEAGRGRFEHLLCERFGPAKFGMALVVEDERLKLVLRRWSIFGVPLPVAWAPFGTTYEHVESGRFCFHVEVGHPLIGPIVKYRGWLVPELAHADSPRQAAPNPALVGQV